MRSRLRRIGRTLAAVGLLTLLFAASAWATAGSLIQKAGTPGCVSETGSAGACADGTALDGATDVVVSPDGNNVYAVSRVSGALSIFDRDGAGVLTQKAGTAGCVSESGAPCASGIGFAGAFAVAISPDGKTVYVTSASAVAILDRDTSTGAVTQKAGAAGCISDTGGGGCTDGTALDVVTSVAVSADGASVYVASQTSGAVAIFDRSTSTGVITQKVGTAGCVSETGSSGACVDGKALAGANSVTVSADGKNVYVASLTSDAVAIFDRNTATGALTQKAGTAGCISETGTSGTCGDGVALDGAIAVSATPDGENVHVMSQMSSAITIFDRNASTGALTQKPGTAGCISETGTSGACVDGKGLVGAESVATSVDGSTAYVASGASNGVAVFARDTSTGSLTQLAGTEGCVTDTGTGGACADGTALVAAGAVVVSPDDKSAYVASFSSDAVAVFDRDLVPETTIDSGPSGPIVTRTPSFAFSSNEGGVSFQCRIDGGTFSFCSGPGATHTPDPLPDGPHTFEVRAVDSGGASDPTPEERSFTIEATAPETSISSGPRAMTSDATPTFAFSADDGSATFECRMDSGPFGACSGPGAVHTPASLADGVHLFEVRATDTSGNVEATPAASEFTIDTALPVTAITRPPTAKVFTKKKLATVRISFRSDDDASFECALDASTPQPCSSPFAVTAKSKKGKGKRHTISVQATDTAGNVEAAAATATFSIVRAR
jgi:DNA-binding beta-propeller fold protein YncE